MWSPPTTACAVSAKSWADSTRVVCGSAARAATQGREVRGDDGVVEEVEGGAASAVAMVNVVMVVAANRGEGEGRSGVAWSVLLCCGAGRKASVAASLIELFFPNAFPPSYRIKRMI